MHCISSFGSMFMLQPCVNNNNNNNNNNALNYITLLRWGLERKQTGPKPSTQETLVFLKLQITETQWITGAGRNNYWHHVVENVIVTELLIDNIQWSMESSVDNLCSPAALVAHRKKTEIILRPSRWRLMVKNDWFRAGKGNVLVMMTLAFLALDLGMSCFLFTSPKTERT